MKPGELIVGRFEVEKLAGSGGMSDVYRAIDRTTRETVALKCVRGCASENEHRRFEREAKLLAGISHSAVVRYVDHGLTAGGEPYLAMEWLEGEDLAARLERGALDPAQTVAVAKRVAEALSLVHDRGGIHRDVKPANLFLPGGRPEDVKLLDFGIARSASRTQVVTGTGVLIGTPGYMAPEQARGERAVDARADIFALGCVVFECAAGRPAFQGDNVVAVLAKVLLEDVPPLRSLCPGVSPGFEDLVARMLMKDPAARPQDASVVGRSLDALGSEEVHVTSSTRTARVAIRDDEQRLFSVILATESNVSPYEGTRAENDTISSVDRIRSFAAGMGGRAEKLVDGTVTVTLSGAGAATDQAGRAARLALELRSILPTAKLSLATGRGVLSGTIPHGEVIDRASRLLLSLAAEEFASAIRIDDLTAGLLGERFDIASVGEALFLRGMRGETGGARTLMGRPTACVGRDREIRSLVDLFDECVEEPVARALLITAPAGVGKTRIRHEFLQRLQRRDEVPTIWIARGEPLGAGSPFAMAIQWVRASVGISDGDSSEVQRAKLRAFVDPKTDEASARRIADFLAEMIGANAGAETSDPIRLARNNAALMRDQLTCAWEDLVELVTNDSPLVLVLEDLQWGDVPSVRLVDSALRNHRDRPIMVLAFARPEVHEVFPKVWSERGLQEIRLATLTRKAAMQMARGVLGDDVSSDTLERIIERASGNAFYLEELIRAAANGIANDLPETVLAMAQVRIEGLSPLERRVLRAASILGRRFETAGLSALLGEECLATDLVDALDRLLASETISRATGEVASEVVGYTFRHGLYRDAAYSLLTERDRVLGHRLAGEWLERNGEMDALRIAEHWERAKEPQRALASYHRAALFALEGNDLRAAMAHAKRALEFDPPDETRASLCIALASAHEWRGEWAEVEPWAARGQALVERGSVLWFRAARLRLDALDMLGERESTIALITDAKDVEIAPATAELAVGFWTNCGRVVSVHGFEALAGITFGTVGRLEGQYGQMRGYARAQFQAVNWFLKYWAGDAPIPPVASIHELLLDLEHAGDLRQLARISANLTSVFVMMGDLKGAHLVAARAIELAERLDIPYVLGLALHVQGNVFMVQGDLTSARNLQERALALFRSQGNVRLELEVRSRLTEIRLAEGDVLGAEIEARELLLHVDTALVRSQLVCVILQSLRQQGRIDALGEFVDELLRMLSARVSGPAPSALYGLAVASESLHAMGERERAVEMLRKGLGTIRGFAARIADSEARAQFLTEAGGVARVISLAREWGIDAD